MCSTHNFSCVAHKCPTDDFLRSNVAFSSNNQMKGTDYMWMDGPRIPPFTNKSCSTMDLSLPDNNNYCTTLPKQRNTRIAATTNAKWTCTTFSWIPTANCPANDTDNSPQPLFAKKKMNSQIQANMTRYEGASWKIRSTIFEVLKSLDTRN